jgi:hypothetical protein
VDGDFADLLGGIAETFGLGELIKGALRGPEAYTSGQSTQTNAGEANGPYAYERWLTRPRDPGINDR